MSIKTLSTNGISPNGSGLIRAAKAIDLVFTEVKSGSIGLLGTSVGDLYSAVAASAKDRIKAVFIFTGGAPLSSIIVNSDHSKMQLLAKKRKVAYKYNSDEDYLAALAPMIKLEPMELGDGSKKKNRYDYSPAGQNSAHRNAEKVTDLLETSTGSRKKQWSILGNCKLIVVRC